MPPVPPPVGETSSPEKRQPRKWNRRKRLKSVPDVSTSGLKKFFAGLALFLVVVSSWVAYRSTRPVPETRLLLPSSPLFFFNLTDLGRVSQGMEDHFGKERSLPFIFQTLISEKPVKLAEDEFGGDQALPVGGHKPPMSPLSSLAHKKTPQLASYLLPIIAFEAFLFRDCSFAVLPGETPGSTYATAAMTVAPWIRPALGLVNPILRVASWRGWLLGFQLTTEDGMTVLRSEKNVPGDYWYTSYYKGMFLAASTLPLLKDCKNRFDQWQRGSLRMEERTAEYFGSPYAGWGKFLVPDFNALLVATGQDMPLAKALLASAATRCELDSGLHFSTRIRHRVPTALLPDFGAPPKPSFVEFPASWTAAGSIQWELWQTMLLADPKLDRLTSLPVMEELPRKIGKQVHLGLPSLLRAKECVLALEWVSALEEALPFLDKGLRQILGALYPQYKAEVEKIGIPMVKIPYKTSTLTKAQLPFGNLFCTVKDGFLLLAFDEKPLQECVDSLSGEVPKWGSTPGQATTLAAMEPGAVVSLVGDTPSLLAQIRELMSRDESSQSTEWMFKAVGGYAGIGIQSFSRGDTLAVELHWEFPPKHQ